MNTALWMSIGNTATSSLGKESAMMCVLSLSSLQQLMLSLAALAFVIKGLDGHDREDRDLRVQLH